MFDRPDPKSLFLSQYGSAHHIDSLMDKNHPEDTRSSYSERIIKNPMATKDHLTQIFPKASSLSDDGLESIAVHHNIPDHIKHHIIDSQNGWATDTLMNNPSFTKDDLNRLAKKTNSTSVMRLSWILKHKLADDSTINSMLDNANERTKVGMFGVAGISHHHISKAMQDHSPFVRWAAIKHPNADIKDVEHAAKHDPEDLVRLGAIKNKYAPRELIQHVHDNDPDPELRKSAKRLLDTES